MKKYIDISGFNIKQPNRGNAAIEILKDFEGQYAAVGVKHMNPCGVGIGENIEAAWDKAYEADSISIFGGIVALNAKVEKGLRRKNNVNYRSKRFSKNI